MKKIIAAMLSAVMLSSAFLPVGADGDGGLTNVALNRPGFSTWEATGHFADLATDGDASTYFANGYAGWYMTDLGAAYTINEIRANLGTNTLSNLNVYASNERVNFNTGAIPTGAVLLKEIGTTEETVTDHTLVVTTTAEQQAAQYRYVLLQKPSGGMQLNEIEVLTSDTVNDPFYLVEVGAFKPVITSSYKTENGTISENYHPWHINDRVSRTVYESTDISWAASDGTDPGMKQKIVIDLESEMPLYGIEYRPTNYNRGGGIFEKQRTHGVNIYVSNDPLKVDDANLVFSGDTTYSNNYYELPDSIYGDSFRYVVVQSSATSIEGYYHQMLTIENLCIYSDNSQTPNYSTEDTGRRAHLMTLGKTTTSTNSGSATGQKSGINDGDLTTVWANAAHCDALLAIDLGEAKTIDYITAITAGTGSYANNNYKVFVTNAYDTKFDDNDVLVYEGSATGMQQGILEVFPATDEMDGQTYRYVCIMIPDPNGVENTSNFARWNVAELTAYTKEDNLANMGSTSTPTPAPEATQTPTPTATPTATPDAAFDSSKVTNIATNKSGFAINSAAGTDPRLALDGNSATYWQSKGAYGLRSELIIDLGAAYPIEALGFMPSVAGAADNIKVYGANNAMFTDKAQLATVTTLAAPTQGEDLTNFLTTGNRTTAYRYVIIERPKEATETPFGFAEIAVYTLNANAAEQAENGAVSLMTFGKKEYLANEGSRFNDQSNVATSTRQHFVDDDPTTGTGFTQAAGNVLRMMVDLGVAMPISHVAYQNKNSASYGSNFRIVATNNEDFMNATYATLATVGVPTYDNDSNTGLLIFPVTDTTAYRYVGIISTYGDPVMRLSASTFQAYAKADDVTAYVEAQGSNYIVSKETTDVSETQLNYSAEVLNGTITNGKAIGLFDRYENGMVTEKAYAESPMALSGAYNPTELIATVENAETGTWEMAALNGQTIFSYHTRLGGGNKAMAYTGTAGSSKKYEQVGNTFTLSGTADAGVLGMMILKPGASVTNYGKDDIYTHEILKAPTNSSAPWNYTFTYSILEEAPRGVYTVALICDNADSGLIDTSYEFNKVDVSQLKEDFASVTADNFMTLVNRYDDFFGVLIEDLSLAENAYGTIGESFIMARDAFLAGLLDDNTHAWPDAGTIALAAKAAIILDATLNAEDFDAVIDAHGSTMPKIFGSSDYNPVEFEQLLPDVLGELSVETAQDLVKAYKRTLGLSLIAGGTLQEKEKALAYYGTSLGIDSDTLDNSHDLLDIAEELSNDINTVKNSYATGMNTVITNIIKKLDNASDKGPSSVGSGGGRGTSSGSVYFPPREIETVMPEKAPEITQDESQATNKFTDLGKHPWAEPHITKLVERGIISGKGEGIFDPDGMLTREEAVKLLVLVTNLDTDLTDNLYLDCEKGAWYYPFVSAAKANNLVTGISKEEFGIGQLVTRQDLTVMLNRAMLELGRGYEGTLASFADDTTIAAYAKDAVGALGALGIITGFEDGSFAPTQHTTRAQAAVIFGRFLDMIDAEKGEAK